MMSESPGSTMDNVLTLKYFPQAVPRATLSPEQQWTPVFASMAQYSISLFLLVGGFVKLDQHTLVRSNPLLMLFTNYAEQRNQLPRTLRIKLMTAYLSGGALLARMMSLAFPSRRDLRVERQPRLNLPLFITRASLVLMDSIAFFYQDGQSRKWMEHIANRYT